MNKAFLPFCQSSKLLINEKLLLIPLRRVTSGPLAHRLLALLQVLGGDVVDNVLREHKAARDDE